VVVVHVPSRSGSPCVVFGGVQVFFAGACEEVLTCAIAAETGDDAGKITTNKMRVGMKNRWLMGAPFLECRNVISIPLAVYCRGSQNSPLKVTIRTRRKHAPVTVEEEG
jgi:hypothetical protein